MFRSFWERHRLHILIVLGFAVIAALYCAPVFSGKILAAHDNISWRGMAHEAQTEYKAHGGYTLWSNSMFGGMPTYTTFAGKSNNLMLKVQDAIGAVLPRPAWYLFAAMACFYLLGLTLKMNRWVTVVGSLAYAFSTYNLVIITAGHDTKMIAIAYMPAVLAGAIMLFTGRRLIGTAVLAFFLSLMLVTGHYQMLYYATILLLVAGIGFGIVAIMEGRMKDFAFGAGLALLSGVLALSTSYGSLQVMNDYAKHTMRGGQSELRDSKNPADKKGGLNKDYAFGWSNGIGETFNYLVPDLFGGSSQEDASRFSDNEGIYSQYMTRPDGSVKVPTYWGPQPSLSGPVYFGAAICFLFLLGLLVVRSPHKWWILAVCIIATVLSWGKHLPGLNYWLFDHVPMLNKFRTVTMATTLPQLLFPLLGIWALHDILEGRVDKPTLLRNIYIAAGITAGLALIVGFGAESFFGPMTTADEARYPADLLEALKDDRAAMARNSGLLSAFYILLAAGVLYLFTKGRLKAQYAVAAMGLVVLIDLVPVAMRYLNSSEFQTEEEFMEVFAPRRVDEQIKQDKDPYYRVLDMSRNTYNDAIQAWHHKVIGGYHPAKLEMYQDLIDEHLGGKGTFNEAVLNMLNTKYIIPPGQPEGQEQFFANAGALGNAWFVEEVKLVNSAREEMDAMKARALGDTATVPNPWDPRKTAIVRSTFNTQVAGLQPGKDSSASVQLAKYGLNEISFTSRNSREGLAVFSDIWYPDGWKAYVDGKETPIIRANYVLRALRLPAGNHNIVFKFHPDKFFAGEKITLFTTLGILILMIAAIWYTYRRRNRDAAADHATVKV